MNEEQRKRAHAELDLAKRASIDACRLAREASEGGDQQAAVLSLADAVASNTAAILVLLEVPK